MLGAVVLILTIDKYFKTLYDIQSTAWQPAACKIGATRITREKKIRQCDDNGSCTYYYCYTPEVEVQLQGSSEKVWAKEFHEDSDEDCWLYRPLAERWLDEKDYDNGETRSCMYDVGDQGHVKFSPTRAPIHWWTWLWYFWMLVLGLLQLSYGITMLFELEDRVGTLLCSFCSCCKRPGRETDPLLGSTTRFECDPGTWDVVITVYHALWFCVILGIAFFGPSTWQGSHPGITGTKQEFQQKWSTWARGDPEFLDHMINNCDVLYKWTVIGIAVSEVISLWNCAIRYGVSAKASRRPVAAWLTMLDMWPSLDSEEVGNSMSKCKIICFILSHFISVVARLSVMNGLLQYGDGFGGLSSYIAGSRNNVVHCCDLVVLYVALIWIFANITHVLIAPFLVRFGS